MAFARGKQTRVNLSPLVALFEDRTPALISDRDIRARRGGLRRLPGWASAGADIRTRRYLDVPAAFFGVGAYQCVVGRRQRKRKPSTPAQWLFASKTRPNTGFHVSVTPAHSTCGHCSHDDCNEGLAATAGERGVPTLTNNTFVSLGFFNAVSSLQSDRLQRGVFRLSRGCHELYCLLHVSFDVLRSTGTSELVDK